MLLEFASRTLQHGAVFDDLAGDFVEIPNESCGRVSATSPPHMANANALRARAKEFAVRVLRFVRTLPKDTSRDAVARQLAKSGPSVSANYHSAGRSRSRSEFIARLAVVVDEADESVHWLSVLKESGLADDRDGELEWLIDEARQLRAIFWASLSTARRNRGGQK